MAENTYSSAAVESEDFNAAANHTVTGDNTPKQKLLSQANSSENPLQTASGEDYSPEDLIQSNKGLMQPGSVASSVFGLVILCLGSGTLTFPYIFYANGLVFGVLLIVFGSVISVYTGWLIVKTAEYCEATRYEDIALKLYGRGMSRFTSVMILLTMLGFVIAYIVLLKSLLPQTLETLMDKTLPSFMGDTAGGHVFWSALFSYAVVFPLTLVRKLSALRFASLFSFFCGIYVVLVLVCVCLVNRDITPDLGGSLSKAAGQFDITAQGIFNSFPLIVFSFMYQPNLPSVYSELQVKTPATMWKVLLSATIIAVVSYAMAGYFGYATFALYPDVDAIMQQENILQAPYGRNGWVLASQLFLLVGVILASPLCLMPCKDTIEELWLGQGRVMNKKQNLICTVSIVTICFVLAVAIPNISDAMTVIGATSNPLVGFTLPIVFYLKMDSLKNENQSKCAPHRVIAHVINVVCITTGLVSLILFIKGKVNGDDETSTDTQ